MKILANDWSLLVCGVAIGGTSNILCDCSKVGISCIWEGPVGPEIFATKLVFSCLPGKIRALLEGMSIGENGEGVIVLWPLRNMQWHLQIYHCFPPSDLGFVVPRGGKRSHRFDQ